MATKKRPQAESSRSTLVVRILEQRDSHPDEVFVDRLEAELGDVSRYEIVSSLKELEKAGLGQVVVGRKGQKARFVWSAAAATAVSAMPDEHAPGAASNKNRVSRGEAAQPARERRAPPTGTSGRGIAQDSQLLQHSFHVRPGVLAKLELPADITPAEVDRLCQFLKAIPFDVTHVD